MSRLVVGPLLRYVDETSAAVWVQTDSPTQVTVALPRDGGTAEVACTAGTFTVHGCHFALVEISGLAPGTSWPYTVALDGQQVWPEPATHTARAAADEPAFPPSRIQTVDPDAPLRMLFGSCRTSAPHDAAHEISHGPDVLREYALDLAAGPGQQPPGGAADPRWPTGVLMLGDQVYADEPPEAMREYIRAHREAGPEPPGGELRDFHEYAELYRLAWSEPAIRWLLSTVPSAMIFDDHDLRDDWNTSQSWREHVTQQQWWGRRVAAGIGAYWIYQHLGNMSPAERAADPVYAAVRQASDNGGDGGDVLDAFAGKADADPTTYRWSYHRDLGATRLIMLDSRCARVLTPGRRAMLDDTEWAWFDSLATGGSDHLVIGTSLPYLLPAAIHHVESWNERVCEGAWGRRAADAGERVRQSIDLEHWAAFGRTFTAVARVLADVATGRRGVPPASVVFLSGDVHYSYLAQARIDGARSAVWQAVCSPIRNPLSLPLRCANIVVSFGVAKLVGRLLAWLAGVRRPPLRWRRRGGPWFRNAIASLDITGRHVAVRWLAAHPKRRGDTYLSQLAHHDLTG